MRPRAAMHERYHVAASATDDDVILQDKRTWCESPRWPRRELVYRQGDCNRGMRELLVVMLCMGLRWSR